MFERFTDRARRCVVLAQDIARENMHNFIGEEHLLVAIVREHESIAAQVMRRELLSEPVVTEYLLRHYPQGTETPWGHIPFTPEVKKSLEKALRQSLSLGVNYISPDHLLLALIRDDERWRPLPVAEVRQGVLHELASLVSMRRPEPNGRWVWVPG